MAVSNGPRGAGKTSRSLGVVLLLVLFGSSCATLQLVSTSSSGTSGNANSAARAISGDGRYLLFSSQASNLAASGAPGVQHLYRRDRLSGTTVLVDVDTTGAPAAEDAGQASMSDDGTRVAFATRAQLVPSDTNGLSDVYVRDLAAQTTKLGSVLPDGSPIPVGNLAVSGAFAPALSGDGTKLGFVAYTGEIPPSTVAYVRMVDDDTTAVVGSGQIQGFVFSGDGNHLYVSRGCFYAGGCFPTPFVIDLINPYPYNASYCTHSDPVAISDDGRYLLYDRAYSVGGPCQGGYVRFDRLTWQGDNVGLIQDGQLRGSAVDMSGDGRFVLLAGPANLLPGTSSADMNAFVLDLDTGWAGRVGATSLDVLANAAVSAGAISRDGRVVAFSTVANNLVADDTNGFVDAFARSVIRPTISRVAPSSGGQSYTLDLSITGREFLADAAVSFSGSGITVVRVGANAGGTVLSVRIRIAGDAPKGARSVFVRNPDAIGSVESVCSDCFTVW